MLWRWARLWENRPKVKKYNKYFDTYDIFLFCMPMKDTQNCIQTNWNALILLSIRPRINHFLFINKQCIQMGKGRFSQSQAQMPIHSAKNRPAHCYCYKVYKHFIHRWWRHYVIITSILDRRITPYLGDLCFRKYSSLRIDEFEKLP